MEKILSFFMVAVCAISSASVINYQPGSRISGGSNSGENVFPYAVSMQQINELSSLTRGHRCGGVLVTPQHVLTTASCTFIYRQTGAPVPIVPSDFRIFAGSVSLLNDSNPEQFRIIVEVTRHPDFIGEPAYINDIAVLTLNNPFNNTVATPLSLPSESFVPAENAECVVVGWGSQNITSSASITQRYARKYISNMDACRLQYNLNAGPNILPSMVCALPFDNLSVGCIGDIGNGLVCNGGLAGVLSLYNRCASTTFPEIYTRVGNYTRWIRSVTGAASTFQPGLAVLVMFTVIQLLTTKIIS